MNAAVASSSSGEGRVSRAVIAHATGHRMSASPRFTSRDANTPTLAPEDSPTRTACSHPSRSSHARSDSHRAKRSTPGVDARIARDRE